MAERRKPTTRRTTRSRQPKPVQGVKITLRGDDDRPQDPLLVPHLEPLIEALDKAGEQDEGERYPRILETICGVTDDSQPVEQYDGTLGVTQAFVAAHQRAACQVQWNPNLGSIYSNPGNVSGVRWGSGVMISPDLMLTAGHLFDQTGGSWMRPRVNGTTNVISPQEIATNMHVNFNFQVDSTGTLRVEDSYAITQLIEYRLGGVDFAVCRIAGNPGNTYGWETVSTVDAAINDDICIIGHPAGEPKRIEAGPCTNLSGNQILYNDIDTLGGNSGSGIWHETSGQIVGVHTNGGCNAAGTGSNFGMRITAIRAQSPTITAIGTATRPLADAIATGLAQDLGGAGGIATFAQFDKNLWDDIATTYQRDVQPTRPVIDKNIWDDFATSFNRDVNPTKRFDDVKAAGLDKQFDTPVAVDPLFDPASLGAVVGRPFALATPHHAPVLGGFAGVGQQAFGESGQLEAALAEAQQALVQLASQVEALQNEVQGGGRNRSSG